MFGEISATVRAWRLCLRVLAAELQAVGQMRKTAAAPLAPVHDVEHRLRDLVNMTRRSRELRERGARWHQLCAAMDVIGDTQLALQAAIDGTVAAHSTGAGYVVIYGVLQALYLQQDAAKQISKCLDIDIPTPPELEEVRDARNAAAGHPSVYKGSGAGIVRITLSTGGFELVTWTQSGAFSRTHVDLHDLCSRQAAAIHRFLTDVVQRLESDEMEHRRRHRGESFEALFGEGILHPFEKLSAAARGEDPFLWEYGVDAIAERLESLRTAIRNRGYKLEDLDMLNDLNGDAEFVLERLRQFFRNERTEMERRDASVYVGYLRCVTEKIRELCREMDAEYASDEI